MPNALPIQTYINVETKTLQIARKKKLAFSLCVADIRIQVKMSGIVCTAFVIFSSYCWYILIFFFHFFFI